MATAPNPAGRYGMISRAFLPEFDQETATTRKLLERVPDGKFDWKPHVKSGSLGWLAGHLANLPSWVIFTVNQDSLDLNPPGSSGPKPPQASNRADVLAQFDKNVADARQVIAGANDEELMRPWSLLNGGKKLFTLPKAAVLRSFVFNHLIHHRGQLSVYLRLLDVPVPSMYGPSADENPFA